MLNYGNLNDVDFEYLCQDIMSRKLGVELHRYARGADGGIDLCDNISTKNIIVQIKHYQESTVSALLTSLKKEIKKVKEIKPKYYYVCCSKRLSPAKKETIYNLFSDYMESPANIITLNEIDSFLDNADNADVLQRHFKLWIDSAEIMKNMLNEELFVDCESLFVEIEKEEKLFVQTQAYQIALDCLEKNRSLFIVGNPGVGKTMTSKMLVLNYAKQGYRVRFTTNTADLQQLKRSLQRGRNTKEIVLIDDCFGQAYFRMKETQSNELLSLIRYIKNSPNKLLILNSRITIYKEAGEQNSELIKSINNKDLKIYMLDMDSLSKIEKAKILYNHLVSNDIGEDYYNEVVKEKRYYSIINHTNFNPRLIEFISTPAFIKDMPAEGYYDAVMKHLKNPKIIWKEEYERRMSKTDRMLLSTIYSFSDEGTNIKYVKEAFNYRINKEEDIDKTIDQFEGSLNRLLEGAIRITDKGGEKLLQMANPSVNDFLDGRFKDNKIEKEHILNNALYVEQIQRLSSFEEYVEYLEKQLVNFDFDDLLFIHEGQKIATATFVIIGKGLKNERYSHYIMEYIRDAHSLEFQGKMILGSVNIAMSLFKDKDLCQYYRIKEKLCEENNLSNFLEYYGLEEIVLLVNSMEYMFKDEDRKLLKDAVRAELEVAVDSYYDYADPGDYDPDVNEALEYSTSWTEYGLDVDEDVAVDYLAEEVNTLIEQEVCEIINRLPLDIANADEIYTSGMVNNSDIRNLIEAWQEPAYEEFDYYKKSENASEIEYIFERSYKE